MAYSSTVWEGGLFVEKIAFLRTISDRHGQAGIGELVGALAAAAIVVTQRVVSCTSRQSVVRHPKV